MKANSPATLAWAVTSAPRQVILNEKDIAAEVRESQNGWHTLKVPVKTGQHRVELIW